MPRDQTSIGHSLCNITLGQVNYPKPSHSPEKENTIPNNRKRELISSTPEIPRNRQTTFLFKTKSPNELRLPPQKTQETRTSQPVQATNITKTKNKTRANPPPHPQQAEKEHPPPNKKKHAPPSLPPSPPGGQLAPPSANRASLPLPHRRAASRCGASPPRAPPR